MKLIAVVGQKGGVGKSTLARGLAVELARKNKLVLVDLDAGQRTVLEWAQARELNKHMPPIQVVSSLDDVRDAEIVVADAPGWTDQHTARIACLADLIVLPTGAGVDDLRPAIRLASELAEIGADPGRFVLVLNRVNSDAEEKAARAYLQQAELAALKEALRELVTYRQASGYGLAITEVRQEGPRDEAKAVVAGITARLKKVGTRPANVDFANMDWSWLNVR